MKTPLLFLLLFTACPHPVTPQPVPPPPSPSDGPATCADVCRRYSEIRCPAAEPTPEGHTCVEVCENLQTSGILSWNLDCRARAVSCAAADACEWTRR